MAPTRENTNAKEPYLKGKNALYLCSFVSINVAVFLYLLVGRGSNEAGADHIWHRVTMKDGVIAAAVPIIAIVLSGIFGDVWKARLVFWRWANPLPGCRVFSELLAADPRLDSVSLKRKLGRFPKEPREQNALWFKLYRQHSRVLRVVEAHRNYLLTRDMTAIAAVLPALLPAAVFAQGSGAQIAGLYLLALAGQYVLIARAATNYGNRFVLNVLSEELEPPPRGGQSEAGA